MFLRRLSAGIALLILTLHLSIRSAAAQIERIGVQGGDVPAAVVVPLKHLVFTSQIYPTDTQGNIVGSGGTSLRIAKGVVSMRSMQIRRHASLAARCGHGTRRGEVLIFPLSVSGAVLA